MRTPRLLRDIPARAFTMVEVMIAVGMLGVIAAGGVQALLRMNHNAALSRLQTGASTLAQNRIDLILSDGPFNPQKGKVPPVLALGTQTIGSAASPTLPIYTDPVTDKVTFDPVTGEPIIDKAQSQVSVWGWLESTVTDTATTYNGNVLNMYRATVTVSYVFRGRTYKVTMNTVRASDI